MTHRRSRKPLDHDSPVEGGLYFVTICARPKGTHQLCRNSVSAGLRGAAAFYHDKGAWNMLLFLLMPDHVHGLFYLPREGDLEGVVRRWKSWTARRHGVTWQKRFFDHRVRHDESAQAKWEYIRQNPVRAGLVDRAEDWPHFWCPPEEELMHYF